MDTVAKGNAFEDKVFTVIKAKLEDEDLGLVPRMCKIFKKKHYYSRDRHSDIETDISIELFLPGQSEWSLLWVIECKDYKGSLPVGDLEEFHAVVQQIAGDNVKASLAISGALQRSALEYARAKGIGVFRILPDDQITSVLHSFFGLHLLVVLLELPLDLLSLFSKRMREKRRREKREKEREYLISLVDRVLTTPDFVAVVDEDFCECYACVGRRFLQGWLYLIKEMLNEDGTDAEES